MDKKTQFLRRLPVIIGVICTLIIGVGVYFLQSMFEKPAQAKKQVQQITMIQPPPPPPLLRLHLNKNNLSQNPKKLFNLKNSAKKMMSLHQKAIKVLIQEMKKVVTQVNLVKLVKIVNLVEEEAEATEMQRCITAD